MALGTIASVAIPAVATLIGSLFGGSDKILFPVPGDLPDGFLAMRFVDPTISEEHYLDVNTGITYRWSYEGDRFKETGRVDEAFRQTALRLMGTFFESGVFDPNSIGIVSGPVTSIPGLGSLQPIGGDITSLIQNAGLTALDNPFLPTEKGDPLIWTKVGLGLAAQVVGTLIRQLLGKGGAGATRVIQNAAGRLTRPGGIPPMFLELGLLDMGSNVLETVGAKAGQFFDDITQPIRDTFISVADTIQTEVGTVLQTVSSGLDTAIGWITEFVTDIGNVIQDTFTNIVQSIQDAFNGIVDFIYATIGDISAFVQDTFNAVLGFFEGLFTSAVETLQLLGQVVADSVRSAINTIADLAVFVKEQIQGAFDVFLSGAQSVIATLQTGLEAIPGALEALGQQFGLAFKESLGDPFENEALPALKALAETLGLDKVQTGEDAARIFESWIAQGVGASPGLQNIAALYKNILPQSTLGQLFMGVITGFALVVSLTQGIAEAKALQMSQVYALDNPYRLPTPEQLVEGVLRGVTSETSYDDQIRRQGLDSQAGSLLRKTRENLPPAGSLLDWKFRGFIDEGTVDDVLRRSGWTDEFIGRIKQAGFVLPPVQDLITMAVREVFTPEVAEKFGQFQDFPQAFADNAAKLGLTDEWAQRYWAAHWNLPSPQMGFEMLHRRVITQQELDTLLRALDVMPFWRDKLTQISFNPLTRVDIRRMHKLNILDDSQVFAAYLDIGYNEVNATHLLNFTKELNREKDEFDDIDIKALTRSNILRFYTEGIIQRVEAQDLLVKAGYANDSVNLLLESADFQLELDERKETINLILEQANAGLITFEQAQDKLASAGLETVEKDRAVARLTRMQAQRVKQPSRAELDRMLKVRVIDESVYQEEMARLGYSPVWSERFMRLAKMGQEV